MLPCLYQCMCITQAMVPCLYQCMCITQTMVPCLYQCMYITHINGSLSVSMYVYYTQQWFLVCINVCVLHTTMVTCLYQCMCILNTTMLGKK